MKSIKDLSRRLNYGGNAASIAFLALMLLPPSLCVGESPEDEDAGYIAKFREAFPEQEKIPKLEEYAASSRYDELYLGDSLERALRKVTNDTGGMAWGLSYRMRSLNEMFRATEDPKYLRANLQCIEAAMAARDNQVGKVLWTGVKAPAWGSDKYAQRGRAVFAVHTGVIVFPMFDLLFLSAKNADFRQELDEKYGAVLDCATEALAFHDRQWREGPGESEGHYIGLDQEDVLENKPLPGNRLSAMGRALWASWKVTGNRTHRERALGIGTYIRNRLTPSPDGAYYWPYWLPVDPVSGLGNREDVNGEDTSHAGLTASFPFLLAKEGEVFDEEDLKRFGKTVINGFGRLGEGILLGDITGKPSTSHRLVWGPARWIHLEQQTPGVQDRLLPYYLRYVPKPGPLDLALLLKNQQ